HFACCIGNTRASELDIRSSPAPILLTTLKAVPSGALSPLGTVTSIGRGMVMGWTMWAILSLEMPCVAIRPAIYSCSLGEARLLCCSIYRQYVAAQNTNYCNKSPGVKGACQRSTAELRTSWQNAVLLGVQPTRYPWPYSIHLWLASCSRLIVTMHEVQERTPTVPSAGITIGY
ncbi:hypothetical protein BJY52DRAFT_1127591, partial [Lactarius psammicola]